MKPGSAIKKGKRFEDWFASWLRQKGLDKEADRQIGSGSGRRKGDIRTSLPFTFELKDVARPTLSSWIDKVDRQTFDYQYWAVVWHPPRQSYESSVAVVPLDVLERLLRVYAEKPHEG